MKAFYTYHPEGTEEEREKFMKIRNEHYYHIRRMYCKGKITDTDRDGILDLVHQANLEELEKIKPHLWTIDQEGVRIDDLRNKITPKENCQTRRKTLVRKEVTADTRVRDFWVNKTRRLICKELKAGKISQERKDKLYAESRCIFTPAEAQEWHETVTKELFRETS